MAAACTPSHHLHWKRMFCKCLQQWKQPTASRMSHSSLVSAGRGVSYRGTPSCNTSSCNTSLPWSAPRQQPPPICVRHHLSGHPASPGSLRGIQTEREYVPLADATLETIQDAVDSLLDRQTLIEYEVSLSSGVLTLKFPPHGTWVINKQTPNLQLWVRRRRRGVLCSLPSL
jgi:Frataxin-like domain